MRETMDCDPGAAPGDSAYQKIKLDLALAARRWRQRSELSRNELAERIAASSAPTGLEESEPPVSLDLLVRSLLALGATRRDIALEIVRDS